MENKSKSESSAAPGSFAIKTVGIIGATVLVAGLLSFIVIPVMHGREEGLDVFAALCRAIGLQAETSSPVATITKGSAVAFDGQTRRLLAAGDAAKGAEIAGDICTSCHLANTLTTDPKTIPTITGQSARAMFKQLQDIKSGIRESEIMKPIVDQLDERQLSDVVAYYSSLPHRNHDNPESPAISEATIALVEKGDSARALPACAACHETGVGGPLEAPNLTGQYPPYFEAQLKAYADGTRRNDLYARMRIIATKLTPKEMSELSAYYNAPPYPHY